MRHRRSRGFSLLEATVTLAIAALVLGSLAFLIADAASLDRRLDDQARTTGQAEALFALLQTLLTDVPRELEGDAIRASEVSPDPAIMGTDRRISVLSRGPRVLAVAAPVRWTISLAPDGPNGRIILSRSDQSSGSFEEPVATSVRAMEFRYGYLSGSGGELAWTSNWPRRLSALVMIEARLIDTVSGRRASRIIPVSLALPAICALQPLLNECPRWN